MAESYSSLLDAVLRETIGATTDSEARAMIGTWFRDQPPGRVMDEDACRSLVGYILRQRFRGWEIPTSHVGLIAERLWEDPQARERLRMLWEEASP